MELHNKQIKLLELLVKNEDNPLTLRDIMEKISGLTSPSHVQHHLNQLEKKGYLKRNPSNSKDYKVLMIPEKPICYINLYGMATCGIDGTLLSGDPIDRIPVYSRLISFDTSLAFLVEAKGDSMEPNIFNKDLIITKKQEFASNGEIVVCTLDHEVLIKKYIVINNNQILLESFNKKYSPRIVTNANEFYVAGVVKGKLFSAMEN